MKLRTVITVTAMLYAIPLLSHGISLRFANEQDIPAILQFERDVTHEYFDPLLETHYKHLPAFASANALQDFDDGWYGYFVDIVVHATDRTNSQTQRIVIATTNQDAHTIIGVCAFEKRENSLYLNYLAVAEQARRHGVGTMLLDKALSTYRDIDVCTLETFAFGNDTTLAFYERYGFTNTRQLCTLDERFPDMLYALTLQVNRK